MVRLLRLCFRGWYFGCDNIGGVFNRYCCCSWYFGVFGKLDDVVLY